MPEITVSHSEIADSQTITDVMERKFHEKGLNIHVHEVTHLDDDFKRGVRNIKVKSPVLMFTVPDLPWHKKKTDPASQEGLHTPTPGNREGKNKR